MPIQMPRCRNLLILNLIMLLCSCLSCSLVTKMASASSPQPEVTVHMYPTTAAEDQPSTYTFFVIMDLLSEKHNSEFHYIKICSARIDFWDQLQKTKILHTSIHRLEADLRNRA